MVFPARRRHIFRSLTVMLLTGLVATAVLAPRAFAARDDSQPGSSGDFTRGPHSKARSTALAVRAVDAALDGKYDDAAQMARKSGDPVAAKLVEWINLRDNWAKAGYDRLMRFVANEPDWPFVTTLRRRAEYLLFTQKADPAVIERHFARFKPLSPEGHIAMARAALARGDKKTARQRDACRLARYRSQPCRARCGDL